MNSCSTHLFHSLCLILCHVNHPPGIAHYYRHNNFTGRRVTSTQIFYPRRKTKVIIYDTMYKNFTEECNIIQKAVNDANEKSKDIQHCYNTLEKRLEELEKEANANAEPCIQRIPILLDDIYNLTNNITCEGNALIEDMDNVFPSCYWTMMKMETCIIAKLNKIRSHLEVFDKNYSLTSEIQRLAFQHITESGVICLKEQVQTAISKARTDIKVAEECIKDTR
ncbi:hypothetical protein KM043_018602 [Ampulex compressa]|nr:hypothetical protein KM043_018602 [Ampulex compressa]